MTATILKFKAPATGLELLAELSAFELPLPDSCDEHGDNAVYSDADAKAFSEWFGMFGADVKVQGHNAYALSNAWVFICGEVLSTVAYKLKHPGTYKALCADFSPEQHDYITALCKRDLATVRKLLPETDYAPGLRQALRDRTP